MNKMLLSFTIILLCMLSTQWSTGQDLLDLLGEEEVETEYVNASFKTSRVINAQSLENTAPGVLDLKISHRFGLLSTGFYEIFGLDAATIRIGFDYGLNDRIMVGVGRSSFQKTYDGFVKAKLLRQSIGKKTFPFSLLWYSGMTINTLKREKEDEKEVLDFKHRLTYTHQLIIGRKFSDSFSLQLMPTYVHRNLVGANIEENGVLIFGAATRLKISKRVAINLEYHYILPDQVADNIKNSLSIGFDIETGGHVFQLHFTNSTSMVDKGYLTETANDWLNGDIHFGFNISRVFTITNPKHKKRK